MGMAASQARFLGLTARRTNIEFEGQQINQQRTALANQSANYYNDLLGMSVPVPPSVDEFTKTVYTFADGALTNEVTAMIAQNDGSYTVSYLQKWQDDYVPVAASTSIINVQNNNYFIGATPLRPLGSIPGGTTVANSIIVDGKTYAVSQDNGGYFINKTNAVKQWVDCTAEKPNFEYYHFNAQLTSAEQAFLDTDGSFYTLDGDGNKNTLTGLTEDDMIIALYDDTKPDPESAVTLVNPNGDGTYSKEVTVEATEKTYLSQSEIQSITRYASADDYPEFAGMTEEQVNEKLREEAAWAEQLEQKYGTGDWQIRYHADTTTGTNVPYFYKTAEIEQNKGNVDENGNILTNIHCYTIGSDIKTQEVKAVEGCRVERDSSGRFISIHIPNPDDPTTYAEYALTTSTTTDQDAYNDAMNKYEHQKYLYDQAIQDINSKIEIVQAQDKNLELRMKQLDTEHNAVQTEIDSVSKVIEKNVESSFRTFG